MEIITFPRSLNKEIKNNERIQVKRNRKKIKNIFADAEYFKRTMHWKSIDFCCFPFCSFNKHLSSLTVSFFMFSFFAYCGASEIFRLVRFVFLLFNIFYLCCVSRSIQFSYLFGVLIIMRKRTVLFQDHCENYHYGYFSLLNVFFFFIFFILLLEYLFVCDIFNRKS